ncbi:MAG: hypothetical protein HDQ95_03255 [Roseburia sp.]|nr:hypothetical protein [Roseburia sp.]
MNNNEETNSADPVKKKKKAPKIILATVIILLCGLFFRGMYMSGWSFDQLKTIIAEGSFQCFISHDFKDATCEHGLLCRECGYETGEKTDHQWQGATCTEPKTCSICHETSGEATGHTTQIGYCKNCGDYIAELAPQLSSIQSYLSSSLNNLEAAGNYFSAGIASRYLQDAYISNAYLYIAAAADNLSNAISVCGSYHEFIAIKIELNNAKGRLDNVSSDLSAMTDDVIAALDYIIEAEDKLVELGP